MTGHPPSQTLPTHSPELFRNAVREAAELLRSGDVAALPTETVYGLAANALDPKAVARIFEIKGRPAHNPIIVHVADTAMARRCSATWPESATRLAAAFWPGPLTLVLGRSKEIPDIVTAGGSTVGIRWPSHPYIQAVIRECGFPLAAPSANLSGRVSPTTAAHVREQLGDTLKLIVDGGPCQVGIESTVIDLTARPPRVLRPGMIHAEALMAALQDRSPQNRAEVSSSLPDDGVLRSPGLLEKHYSPNARLIVFAWRDDADLEAQVRRQHLDPAACHVIAHQRIPSPRSWAHVSVVPHDAEAFARALYAELHRCDAAGAGWIIVEAPPATIEWRAITDRLARASAT